MFGISVYRQYTSNMTHDQQIFLNVKFSYMITLLRIHDAFSKGIDPIMINRFCRRCSLRKLIKLAISVLCLIITVETIIDIKSFPRIRHEVKKQHNVLTQDMQLHNVLVDLVPTTREDESIMFHSDYAGSRDGIDPFDTGIPLSQEFDEKKRSLEGDEYQKHDCTRWHFSQEHLKATALASFPGSGNTWARYLIQQLTGQLLTRGYSLS